MSKLEGLGKHTIVDADTGDFDSVARHRPQDATTNHSLLLQASQKPTYGHLVEAALSASDGKTEAFLEYLAEHAAGWWGIAYLMPIFYSLERVFGLGMRISP
jgi:transaldolase